MKKRILAAALGMVAGVAILFIPFFMDRRQAYQNALAISAMTSRYDRYDENRNILDEQLSQASVYNKWLAGEAEKDGIRAYEEQLSFDGNGVMGYLWIPSIDLKILLYHGTTDETLAAGAGHLEHTSLPVGGISSHCVVTAHSGMRASRAFDDIRLLR
ncbi:MAG: sortase, partial [Lachnospiraceae bacterium]|nr:sortase [Lachnospiraceae bacterium]